MISLFCIPFKMLRALRIFTLKQDFKYQCNFTETCLCTYSLELVNLKRVLEYFPYFFSIFIFLWRCVPTIFTNVLGIKMSSWRTLLKYKNNFWIVIWGRGFTYKRPIFQSGWQKKLNSADYFVLINNIHTYRTSFLRYFVCTKEQRVAYVHKITGKILWDYPINFPFR